MKHVLFSLLVLVLPVLSTSLSAQKFIIAEDLVLLPFDVTRWETVDSTFLKVRYERVVNDPMRKSGIRKEDFTLQIGHHISKYYSEHTNLMDERFSGLREDGMKMVWFDGSSIYQNMPEGKITVVQREYFSPQEESAANKYEEELPSFTWVFESDTMTILGHLCHKAITPFRGRTWEVWYAPDIPVAVYPWKFNALPGSILAFNDTEGIISCTAKEILQVCEPIKWFRWQYQETTREKQLQYMKQIHERPSLILQDGEPTQQMSSRGPETANTAIPYQPMEKE